MSNNNGKQGLKSKRKYKNRLTKRKMGIGKKLKAKKVCKKLIDQSPLRLENFISVLLSKNPVQAIK